MTTTATRPASEKQLAFIQSLTDDRQLAPENRDRLLGRIAARDLDVRTASATIEWLKAQPRTSTPTPVTPVQDAAEGFYVRGDDAYRVKFNKAGTNTYAQRFEVADGKASWVYCPGVGRSLAAEGLVPMSAGDAARIGLSHGFCVNCCRQLGGKSTSAHVSALIGYGETCANNNGWPYPKGAKAQRAFIAEAA